MPPPVVPLRDAWAHLKAQRGLLAQLFLGVGAVNFAVLGSVSWLPAMLMRGHGMSAGQAGALAGSLLIAGGLVGMIGGGLMMDRLGGGMPAARMRFAMWATVIGAFGGAAFPLLPSAWGFGAAFLLFFSAAAVTVGAAPSIVQQITPPAMRGTTSAVYVFVINLIGLGIGPTATALIGDTLFAFADGIRYAILVIAPGGYVVAAVLFWRASLRLAAPLSTSRDHAPMG